MKVIGEHRGVKISFDDPTHKYVTDNVDDFTSVTTFIHTFFPDFESEKIATRCAKKRGVSVESLLDDWEQEGALGNSIGNNVHDFCEKYLLGQTLPNPVNEKAKAMMSQMMVPLKNFKNNFEIFMQPELPIFSESLKLAGTIDLPAIRKKDKAFCLIDWKTNKKINVYNRYKSYGEIPIDHVDNTNYMHYSLQLNLYEYLLKREDYIPKDTDVKKAIVHILPDSPPKQYNIANMRIEVEMMLRANGLI